MSVSKTVLVIDDDQKLIGLVTRYLEQNGWTVISTTSPTEGLELLRSHPPTLILLDVMMGEMDGQDLCRKIRASSTTPIVMLTARGDIEDKLLGLRNGADDYVLKPFEPRELLARIEAVVRRVQRNVEQAPAFLLRFNSIEIDTNSRTARVDGNPVILTTSEFDVLLLLAENHGTVLSRNEIMDRVRGKDWNAFDRSIDIIISRLRQKLGDDAKNPRFFKTVWGEGYLFIARKESL